MLSNNACVIVMAENILMIIPILKVIANPFMVPVPNQNSTIAAINVVMLASSIVT